MSHDPCDAATRARGSEDARRRGAEVWLPAELLSDS